MHKKSNCHLIGVDTDQSKSLPDVAVLTSAMKGLTDATVTCLDEFYGNWTVGGQVINYGLKSNESKEYVGLPRDTWSMTNFTIAQYEGVLAKIRGGQITIFFSGNKRSNSNIRTHPDIHPGQSADIFFKTSIGKSSGIIEKHQNIAIFL